YVRKGPLPTVTKEENTFLANIIISRERSLEIEKKKKKLIIIIQEHLGLTASKFGEVGSRKAPINKIFLRSLFSSTKGQTQAMKYFLESEPMVVKEFKEVTGPQVMNVVC
ncbi:unnamed protein product, partial [Porites evermanni]